MNTVTSFWPSLDEILDPEAHNPVCILQEQAEYILELSEDIEAIVIEDVIGYTLKIKDTDSFFEVTIVNIVPGSQNGYPLKASGIQGVTNKIIENSEEFRKFLYETFNSKRCVENLKYFTRQLCFKNVT